MTYHFDENKLQKLKKPKRLRYLLTKGSTTDFSINFMSFEEVFLNEVIIDEVINFPFSLCYQFPSVLK